MWETGRIGCSSNGHTCITFPLFWSSIVVDNGTNSTSKLNKLKGVLLNTVAESLMNSLFLTGYDKLLYQVRLRFSSDNRFID